MHFEVPADDPERAVSFYRNVLGWQAQRWEGPIDYWLVTTGEEGTPGINGAIMRREGHTGVVNTAAVVSVDETARKVEANGGKVIMPKSVVPGVGFVIYFTDTEGNVFGAIESDESAR